MRGMLGEVEQFVNRPLVVYVLALASTLPWRVLHRIAFPVVSEWCQYHPRIELRVKQNHRTEGVNALGEPITLAHVRRHLRRLLQGTRLHKLHMAGREAISAKISYTCGRSNQGREP